MYYRKMSECSCRFYAETTQMRYNGCSQGSRLPLFIAVTTFGCRWFFLSQTVILYNVNYKFDPNACLRLRSVLRFISTSPYTPRIPTTKSLHRTLPNLHRTTAWAEPDDHQHGPLPPSPSRRPVFGFKQRCRESSVYKSDKSIRSSGNNPIPGPATCQPHASSIPYRTCRGYSPPNPYVSCSTSTQRRPGPNLMTLNVVLFLRD